MSMVGWCRVDCMPCLEAMHTVANCCAGEASCNYTRLVSLGLVTVKIVMSAGTRFQPPGNVHAPYYPLKGPYSSSDPHIIRAHVQEMLAANITVLVSSRPPRTTAAAAADRPVASSPTCVASNAVCIDTAAFSIDTSSA